MKPSDIIANKLSATYNRDGLECPHCGYVDQDSWEMSPHDENGETECGRCDKPILWTRNISITYVGRKKL